MVLRPITLFLFGELGGGESGGLYPAPHGWKIVWKKESPMLFKEVYQLSQKREGREWSELDGF